jgi:hypothetical protein
LQPTAKPTAVLSNPSIPLAPLFPATRIQWHGSSEYNIVAAILWIPSDQLSPYISKSRIAMLFPTKRADLYDSVSAITCAASGSVSEYLVLIWNDISDATYNKVQENSKETKKKAKKYQKALCSYNMSVNQYTRKQF